MCGIVGFVNTKNDKEKSLERMMTKIAHRGPDGKGEYVDDSVALGHVRLAIIDIESGTQPQFNEDGNLIIIFNGEIYNYLELKQELIKKGHTFVNNSDTEVIIHGYEEWGYNIPKYLRGMFAIAIWDKRNKSLFLARDKAGIKPLYYSIFNGTFMFASEIKALLAHEDTVKELNDSILVPYLCFGFNAGNETFFKGIYNLEAGSYLIYHDGNIKTDKYFTLEFCNKKEITKEMINKCLKDSINHHLISDVQVGSFLSSGVDSSYIASCANISTTYTVGYNETNFSEINEAKNLANILNKENKSLIITKKDYFDVVPKFLYYMDEPLADPSSIGVYFLAHLASKDVKVVLSGEGADELFAGYLSYLDDLNCAWYDKIPFKIRKLASKAVSRFGDLRGLNFIYRRGKKLDEYYIGLGRICRDEEAKKLVILDNQVSTSSITKNVYELYHDKSDLEKRQAIDFNFYLGHNFLPAMDRNCMIFGLEARTPFLDDKVYEIAKSLKENQKVSQGKTKILFRDAAEMVIPSDAYKKKKLGFPLPLKEWLFDDMFYENIKRVFQEDYTSKFFDQKKILKLLNNYYKGRKANYKLIWAIYCFLVWYKIYFIE